MIEREFHTSVRAEAVGAPGEHSDRVVEPLDGAAGDPGPGLKAMEQEFLGGVRRPGDPLDGFDPAAHGPPAPVAPEAPSIRNRAIAPGLLDGLFQIPAAGGGQTTGQQAFQLGPAAATNSAAAARQRPADYLEGLGQAASAQASGLLPTDLMS